jgi:ABC-type transporter Mla maintaining outer membrane lipid asymmetry permease subunit MlaE
LAAFENLTHRANHRHIDIIARILSPRRETGGGLFQSDGDPHLRADFQHLRRWRKSVEQAQSYTFKAVITIIVTGFVGAVWLGIKIMLGK